MAFPRPPPPPWAAPRALTNGQYRRALPKVCIDDVHAHCYRNDRNDRLVIKAKISGTLPSQYHDMILDVAPIVYETGLLQMPVTAFTVDPGPWWDARQALSPYDDCQVVLLYDGSASRFGGSKGVVRLNNDSTRVEQRFVALPV